MSQHFEYIAIWPNDDYCYEDQLEEYLQNKSDDYALVAIPFGVEDIDQFVLEFNR